MKNLKLETPQNEEEIRNSLKFLEIVNPNLSTPFQECTQICVVCNRQVCSQAETFVDYFNNGTGKNSYTGLIADDKRQSILCKGKTILDTLNFCSIFYLATKRESLRIKEKYGQVLNQFPPCAYLHLFHSENSKTQQCINTSKTCKCKEKINEKYLLSFTNMLNGE